MLRLFYYFGRCSELDSAYHYPPELFELLVETVPRLVRSKKALLDFFKGAGVSASVTTDIEKRLNEDRNCLNKYEITRLVLTRINEAGDPALFPRREIIRRVTCFEDFTCCYENDRLPAEGLVARVRQLVNVKDSFTRMNIERQAERQQRIKEQETKQKEFEHKQAAIASIRSDIGALYNEIDPHRRGKALESVLNRLFKIEGILIREAFTLIGDEGEGVIEQVDGAIDIDGEVYLVEMKWLKSPLGKSEVAEHLVRLFNRGAARGIFIAANGYTAPAISQCKDALHHKVVFLCEMRRIQLLLEQGKNLRDYLRRKAQAAISDRDPSFEPPL